MGAGGAERNQGTESATRVVQPSISANGRFVAYATTASNVVTGDNNAAQDVFVCDVETNNTSRVSVNSYGEEGNADSPIGQGEKIAISADGTLLSFTSNTTNLGSKAGNILLYNLTTHRISPVTALEGSIPGRPSISGWGNYVVFGAGAKLDSRFPSSGLFAFYTGTGPCINCQ